MAETWKRALDSYVYPVDLRQFAHAEEYPGWFQHRLALGNRDETMQFEQHFREHARSALAPWLEVVLWKMYSQGGRRDYRTQCIAEQLESSNVSAGELWEACRQYVNGPSRQTFDGFRRLFHFGSEAIAIVATFPAFMAPDRFPMVDSKVAQWTRRNAAAHNDADPRGPQLVPPQVGHLTMRHWPFVESWTEWCRHTARKLAALTQAEWRARDVEMAVFSACPTVELEPLTA